MQRSAEWPPFPVRLVCHLTLISFFVHSNISEASLQRKSMCAGSPSPCPMRVMSAARFSGASLMPCAFCTDEPGTAIMPPEEFPPIKAIFSITRTSAPASFALSAAASPAKPDPMTTTSCISSNYAGIGSRQAALTAVAAPAAAKPAATPMKRRREDLKVIFFSFS